MKLNELECKVDYFQFDKQFYQQLKTTPLNHPHLISYSKDVCDLIDLDYSECETKAFVDVINGKKLLQGSQPFSMAYAGHQFGYFVPQLGDGRAINLGSINGYHLQSKGSGLTKYSRHGDGRAVLRSSIREYIMSEVMFHLNIPTTRALALIGSSHKIYRSYEEVETGAIVMRLSPSWIRIGTFEYFARSKNAQKHLRQLANYVIQQSYPHLHSNPNKYEKMFYELVDNTAVLLAQWQAYGFMHGVMNTDNMSMAGLTIDYGPFAFMDYFDKGCICNHSDTQGRYAYNNQPHIAKWNLEVLAQVLGKICDGDRLLDYLETFYAQHVKAYKELMCQRLGLDARLSSNEYEILIIALIDALQKSVVDYNLFFYRLTQLNNLDNMDAVLDICMNRNFMQDWLKLYKQTVQDEKRTDQERQSQMKKVNPKYIIKNYMLQESIDKAKQGDFSLVNALLEIARKPFDEHKSYERYAQATPQEYANLQLSCSS